MLSKPLGALLITLAVGQRDSAVAATATWSGLDAGSNWTTPGNWKSSVLPTNNGLGDVVMAGSTNTAPIVDVPWSINLLRFASGAAPFHLFGSQLSIGAGGVLNDSANDADLSLPVLLTADQTWRNAGGHGVYSSTGGINTNGFTLTYPGGNGFLGGGIAGSGAIAVTTNASPGASLLGTNTHTGGTRLKSGITYIGGPQSFGASTGPIYLEGGTFALINPTASVFAQPLVVSTNTDLNFSNAQFQRITFNGAVSGAGRLTLRNYGGSGEFLLTGTNTNTGGIAISGGLLIGTSDSLKGNIASIEGGSSLQFDQSFNGTYAGNASGDFTLYKLGTGIVNLTGVNTYLGNTNVGGGVLEVSGSAIPAGSRVIFNNSGVLQYAGGASISPAVDKVLWNGAGGFSARDGKLTVNIGGNSAPMNGDIFAGGSQLRYVFGSSNSNAQTEFKNGLALGNSGVHSIEVKSGVGGDYLTMSGLIAGSSQMDKNGAGTLQLTGNNTFTGTMVVKAGALQAADGVGLPTAAILSLDGGVLLSTGPGTFTRAVGTTSGKVSWTANGGGFASGGGVYDVNLGGAAAQVTWGTTGFLPNSAPLVLGSTRAAGETRILNAIAFGTRTREVRVDPGLGGDFATLAGVLSGTGGLTKSGAGTLVLPAVNIYSGNTTVSAGTLVVPGELGNTFVNVLAGATFSSTGTLAGRLAIVGGTTLATSAALSFLDNTISTFTLSDVTVADTALTLGGSPAGTVSRLYFDVGAAADRIVITTAGLLVRPGGATITINPLADFQPGIYDLIKFPTGRGVGLEKFSLTTDVIGDYFLSLQTTPSTVQLIVSVVPEPGCIALTAAIATVALGSRPRRRRDSV